MRFLCTCRTPPPVEEELRCDSAKKSHVPEPLATSNQEPMKLTEEQWAGKWNQSTFPPIDAFVCSMVYDAESLRTHHNSIVHGECAVIDAGSANTAVGGRWVESFSRDAQETTIRGRSGRFKFGDSRSFDSLGAKSIPVNLAGISLMGKKHFKMRCDIRADVVSTDIPLLISRQSLQTMNSAINFSSDELTIGRKITSPLRIAENGHPIPLLTRASHATEKEARPTFVREEPTESGRARS